MGDCGLTQSLQSFPLITLPSSFLHLSSLNVFASSTEKAPLLAVIPKLDITAFHINMSDVMFGLSRTRSVELDELIYTEYVYSRKINGSDVNDDYRVEEIESGTGVVHIATMSRQLGLLTVLLRNEESTTTDYTLPVDIYFNVKIRIINTTNTIIDSFPPETEVLANTTSQTDDAVDSFSDSSAIDGRSHRTQFSFRVRIGAINDTETIDPRFGQSPLTTYTSSVCKDNEIIGRVLKYPQISHKFSRGHVDTTNIGLNKETEVVLFEIDVKSNTSIERTPIQDLQLFMTYSLLNGSQALYQFPLCDIIDFSQISCGLSLSELVEKRRIHSATHWESSYTKRSHMSQATFKNINQSAYVEMQGGFYLLVDHDTKGALKNTMKEASTAKVSLVLPVPIVFSEFEVSWLHLDIKLTSKSQQTSSSSSDEKSSQACWSSLISWGGKEPSNITLTPTSDFNSSKTIHTSNVTSDTIGDQSSGAVNENRRLSLNQHEYSRKSKNVFDLFSNFVNLVHAYDDAFETKAWDDQSNRNSNGLTDRRRLEDTYASSLLFVNRLLNKEFGTEQRKVPAHLPHLIDVEIMEEMQTRWKKLWIDTSSHRFRSPEDMQYAFAYYHYVIHRYKAHEPDLIAFFRNEIDTNKDGFVDDNEFRTVAAITRGKILTPEKIWEYQKCALPELEYTESKYRNATTNYNSSFIDIMKEESRAVSHLLTIEGILNCTVIKDAFLDRMRKEKTYPLIPLTHSDGSDDEVSFEMIYDNATLTEQKLDSVRWRKTKFICLNDNAKEYSPELEKVVRDFFNAMYPIPSPFELPPRHNNPALYTDQHRFWVFVEFSFICGVDIIGVVLVMYAIATSIIYVLNGAASSSSDRKITQAKDKQKYT